MSKNMNRQFSLSLHIIIYINIYTYIYMYTSILISIYLYIYIYKSPQIGRKCFISLIMRELQIKIMLLLLSHFSHVQLCVTPWTAAHQAPPSMGFSRQEYWSGVPLPSPKIMLRCHF